MRVTAATLLGLLIAVFTNYATQFGPTWTTNPWIVWPVLGLLAVFAVIVALRSASPNVPAVPASGTRLDSLRPPTLDVPVRGREAELTRLEKLVKHPRGQFAVVCGPGGTGKTTLAAELAARTGATVWWIRWRDQESFAAQMLEIAEALGMPQVPGRGLPDLVWDALTKHSRWLLVVDNVDRPQALSPTGELLSAHRGWVRDGGGGLLLITSRDTDPHTWGRGAEMITLAPLLTDDAATVLLDAAPHAGNQTQAEALASRLGGFPLALRAAGRALAQPTARHRTFDTYREALDIELADTLAAKHDGLLSEDQERALLRYTWELSLDQLAEEGHPLARPLLRMLSMAADAPLPRDLITPELLQPAAECEVTGAAVDSALAGLHRYGLVLTVSEVALHPLVREINALLLSEESDAKPWLETLDRILLADADETANSGRAGWRRAHLLAPHLVPILGRLGDQPEAVLPARDKVKRVAGALRDAGNAAASELLLWRAVLDAELSVLGPHHRSSLASRGNLANALNDLGEYQQAADLLRQNLADRERMLHVDHPRHLDEPKQPRYRSGQSR